MTSRGAFVTKRAEIYGKPSWHEEVLQTKESQIYATALLSAEHRVIAKTSRPPLRRGDQVSHILFIHSPHIYHCYTAPSL